MELNHPNKPSGPSDSAAKNSTSQPARSSGGMSTEDFADLLEVATYHVKKGVKDFADFSQKMIESIGKEFEDRIRPHLGSLYDRVMTERATEQANRKAERETLGLPGVKSLAKQGSGKQRVEGDIHMTKTQRIILAIGLILFLASAILPPWRDHEGILGPFALLTSTRVTRLDIHRLLVEWVIITVLTGGLLLLTTKGKSQ